MASPTQGAVIVRANLSRGVEAEDTFNAVSLLEEELAISLASAGAGEFDGAEMGQGQLVLYMYGPDPERLLAAVEQVLRKTDLTRAAIVTVRRGPPGSASRDVFLGTSLGD